MNVLARNLAILFLLIAISTSAQMECMPLRGYIKYSHKRKGAIGFDGRLYMPTNRGIIVYDGTNIKKLILGPKSNELADDAVRNIYFSRDSTVWISYHDGGYSTITKDTIQHFFNQGGPSDHLCFDVVEFNDVLYMGTKNGLYPYIDGKFQEPLTISLIENISAQYDNISHDIRNAIRSKDDPNKLWLIGLGLHSYNLQTQELQFYTLPKNLLEDFGNLKIYNDAYLIADLYETSDALYLTCWGGGLLEYSKKYKTWKKHLYKPYEDLEPLNENVFFEIIPYDNSSFIFSNHHRLLQFNLEDNSIVPFEMEGDEALVNKGGVRLSRVEDHVVFANYQNICTIRQWNQPFEKVEKLDTLILSDVKVEGASLNQNNFFFKSFQTEFKNYQRNISFEYDLVAPFNSTQRDYEYQLIGLSDNWVKQNQERSINFSNLEGGNYTFKVRHRFSDGNYSYSTPFNFHIGKYYYENWWFWLLIIIASIGIISTFVLIKWNQKKKELALLDKHSRELAHLEMSALRAQMNPHFLFNSLNSIKNFALTKGPRETAAYLTKFSHLIRLILQNSKNPLVNLKDELDALKLYIEIESLRFENKFKFKFNIDEGLMISSIQIPPLILQPFVENSIWHGLMHKKDGEGQLIISVKDQGNSIQCMIEDNGIGREMAQKIKKEKTYDKQKSLGMDITGNRIALTNKIYNINTDVRVIDLHDKNGKASGTRVLIDIPKSEKMY